MSDSPSKRVESKRISNNQTSEKFEQYKEDSEARFAGTNKDAGEELAQPVLNEELIDRNVAFIKLLQRVAVAANEASSPEDALQFALDQICAHTGWPVGHVYMTDSQSELVPWGIWHLENPTRFKVFKEITEATRLASGVGLPGRVLASGKPAWIIDVTRDPNFPRAQQIKDIGVRAAFGFPVLIDREVAAVLEFYSGEAKEPDEPLLEVMAHIGTQLGRAIERRRAEQSLGENLNQLAKKNRYETIVRTVAESVHRSINLQEVLENAVEAMSQNIEKADNVSIHMIEGNEIWLKAYRGYTEWYIERVSKIPYPTGFTWKAIIEDRPIYCADVDNDTVIGAAGREIGTQSYLSMPVRFDGKPLGAISINSLEKNAFDEEELNLLEIVIRQIEIAINNARQAEALRESELLQHLAEGTASATGADFFRSLVRHLASALRVRYAFVTQCTDVTLTRVRTLAFWTGTRRDLLDPNESGNKQVGKLIKRAPAIVYEDSTLREAVDLMAEEGIGRLPVVNRANPSKVVAILTRSDILSAKSKLLEEARQFKQSIHWFRIR